MTTGLKSKNPQWPWPFIVSAFTLCLLLSPVSCSADLHDTTYDDLFQRYAEIHLPEYDWRWIKAQAYQESRYNPAAVSPVGALGLMQIMPGTGRDLARRTGIDGPLTSALINVMYGTTYMRQMLNIWKSPRTDLGRLELAQASYNAGAGNVIKAQKLSGNQTYWAEISQHMIDVTGRHARETLDYVIRIQKWFCVLIEA